MMAQQYNIVLFGETNSIQDFRINMFVQKDPKMSPNDSPDIYAMNSVEFAIFHNGYPEGEEIHATITIANSEMYFSQRPIAENMVKNSSLSHLPTVSFGFRKTNIGNINHYNQSSISQLFIDLIDTLTKPANIEDNVAPETREIIPENSEITTYEARDDLVIATTVSVKVYKLTI
jgi:glutamate synthase domain-containing protein 1